MDHSSDCSTVNSLRAGIEKLFHIQNMATYLSCQIGESIEILTGATKQDTTDAKGVSISDLGVKLTTAELLELANLENTRQAVMGSWAYIEKRKQAIIQQARTRIDTDRAGQ